MDIALAGHGFIEAAHDAEPLDLQFVIYSILQ